MVLIFTLTVQKLCLPETFGLRRQCFPDLRISVEVVLVLMLARIEPRRRKRLSKTSWMSISVGRADACIDIRDRVPIPELPLKIHYAIENLCQIFNVFITMSSRKAFIA